MRRACCLRLLLQKRGNGGIYQIVPVLLLPLYSRARGTRGRGNETSCRQCEIYKGKKSVEKERDDLLRRTQAFGAAAADAPRRPSCSERR
jgi:hypothetical protein